jgi:mannosyl-oligosaccharide alpha-1,2-mannosidase
LEALKAKSRLISTQAYILLGGNSEQYQHMYTGFIERAKEHIFFRPMVKNRDILISGMATVEASGDVKLRSEGQHLSCFVGGMVALASKVFARPDELNVARKLVDGCVWAYESTPSGIMPEVFMAVDSGKEKKNKWDKKKWLEGVNDQHAIGGQDEVKDMAARAEKIIDALRLPEGMTAIPDRRYILRYVGGLPTRPSL